MTLNLLCLVTQLVKNPPAMQETWVRSLDWEDPLEKGKVLLLLSRFSRVQLRVTPWAAACQAPLSMGILQARMEWVPMPSSRDLPNPGIEPRSPALQADSLLSETPEKAE